MSGTLTYMICKYVYICIDDNGNTYIYIYTERRIGGEIKDLGIFVITTAN